MAVGAEEWARKSGRNAAKRTEVLVSPLGPLPVVATLTIQCLKVRGRLRDGVQRDSERPGSCTHMTRLEFTSRGYSFPADIPTMEIQGRFRPDPRRLAECISRYSPSLHLRSAPQIGAEPSPSPSRTRYLRPGSALFLPVQAQVSLDWCLQRN